MSSDDALQHITTLEYNGRPLNVLARIVFDGIEYIGRLVFADEAWEDAGIPDYAALPGRTRDEVVALASRLSPEELRQRYLRALAHRRRYHGLRRLTDEILAKIRFLNQVAISMRAGLLDPQGATQELDLTEKQLHELVSRLRESAGAEE
ncbi:MAG: hypothetical protein ACJ8AO_18490 [Gemmatimonadaceae bacterium]